MKQWYTAKAVRLLLALFVILVVQNQALAQCPLNGVPQTVQHDTTEITLSGNSTSTYTIPRFNPALGTLIQVEIRAVITGVVRMRLENDVAAPASYRIRYTRNDDIAGPGLAPNLLNSISRNYGPYSLAASDGNLFSGPDFISIGPDTVLRSVVRQRIITTGLVNFLGSGNLNYTYRINASTVVTGSSNYIFTVATTGRVVFSVIYTYCPVILLPVQLKDFMVKRNGARTLAVEWKAANEQAGTRYDVELSRNGQQFRSVGAYAARTQGATGGYKHSFYAGPAAAGRYFFRIRMQQPSGQVQYTPVREAVLEEEGAPGIAIYPNPAAEVLNVSFAQPQQGLCRVQVVSLSGQTIYDIRQHLEQENTIRLVLDKAHRRGMYVLKIFGADGKAPFAAHVHLY